MLLKNVESGLVAEIIEDRNYKPSLKWIKIPTLEQWVGYFSNHRGNITVGLKYVEGKRYEVQNLFTHSPILFWECKNVREAKLTCESMLFCPFYREGKLIKALLEA